MLYRPRQRNCTDGYWHDRHLCEDIPINSEISELLGVILRLSWGGLAAGALV